MGKSDFSFSIDNLSPVLGDEKSVDEEALREHWEVTSYRPLTFKYSLAEFIEKWGVHVYCSIKENYPITACGDYLVCPICEEPLSFSSRGQLERLLANKNSLENYCISKNHEANFKKKLDDSVRTIKEFNESEYIGQSHCNILEAPPTILLKLSAIYFEDEACETSIRIGREFGGQRGLRPFTASLLPDLLRKGYAVYVEENTPYPHQVLEAMDFINQYVPDDWQPRHFYEDYSIRLSRLGFKNLASGYRLNKSNFDLRYIIQACLELIIPHAYDKEFLDEVEDSLTVSRAYWLLSVFKTIGNDYGIPIRLTSSSDLIMKSLAKEVPVKTAIDLITTAAQRSRYVRNKPGVSGYLKANTFLSSLSKLFEQWKADKEIKLSERLEYIAPNECGWETLLHFIYRPSFEIDEMSVNQIIEQLYSHLES